MPNPRDHFRIVAQAACTDQVALADLYSASTFKGVPVIMMAAVVFLPLLVVVEADLAPYARLFLLVAVAVSIGVASISVRSKGLSKRILVVITPTKALLVSASFKGRTGWQAGRVIESWPIGQVCVAAGNEVTDLCFTLSDDTELSLSPKWSGLDSAAIAKVLNAEIKK